MMSRSSRIRSTGRVFRRAAAALLLLTVSGLLPAESHADAVPDNGGFVYPVQIQPLHRAMVDRLLDGSATRGFLPSATPTMAICWREGTDPDVAAAFDDALARRDISLFQFTDTNRWSTTATDGAGLTQGDPTTLTWSIVPDGTTVGGFAGEPASPSNLIAFLDGIYGAGPGGSDLTLRPWFSVIQSIFTAWSAQIGVHYVYEANDDGSSLANFPGVIGTRGDVRISGHTIDGNSGILAYNFFPNNSDMVVDTGDNFFNVTTNNSIRLRNVLTHEHGHGLGLSHVCPVNQTKLMEPFVSTAFDGVQFDDRLAGNRGYGDPGEYPGQNDLYTTATDFGAVAVPGNQSLEVSIDDNSDSDYFSFTVPAGTELSVTLTPTGFVYLSGAQNADGSCSAGTSFNAQNQSDLSLEVYGTSGTNLLASANANGAGSGESIPNLALTGGAGTYYVRVLGSANRAQMYFLQLAFAAAPGNTAPVAVCQDVTSCNGNVVAADVDNGSFDPDGDPITLTLVPAGPYPLGTTAVSLIVDDGSLADTCFANVMVNRAPLAACRNFSVSGSGAGCTVAVPADSLNNGSSDPDGNALTFSLVPPGPYAAGVNAVSFIAVDSCGAADTCFANITVTCSQAPVALCQDVTSCSGNVLAADVDNGSFDPNGDPITLTLVPAGPYAPGTTAVSLIVDDGALADTCFANVMVNRAPVATCRDFSVSGSGAGCTVAVPADSLDNGSSDPDGDALTFSLVPPGPYAAGVNAVSFIAVDSCGAADTCFANITVTCFIGPVLDVTPTSVAFQTVALGDTLCRTVTIHNIGDQPMTVSSVTGCDTGNFLLDLTGLVSPVAPGDSTSFLVCAAPVTAGPDSCQISVVTPESTAAVSVTADGSTLAIPGEGTIADGRIHAAVVPNPFRARAAVRFTLPSRERVQVEVFDFQGRKLRTLVAGDLLDAGSHEATWDGRNDRQAKVAAGIYYIRLVSRTESRVVRAVLLP